jgi:hypothetical protein
VSEAYRRLAREAAHYADFELCRVLRVEWPRRCATSVAFRHNFDGAGLTAMCFCFAVRCERPWDLHPRFAKQ